MMNFRKANIDDAEQLSELAYALNIFHQDEIKPKAETLRKDWDYFEAFVVETKDHVIAGFLTGYKSYQFHTATLRFEIQNIYVSDDFRKQGIGRMLIKNVVKLKSQDGVRRFSLGVNTDNKTARAFYASLGFAEKQPGHQVRCTLDGDALDNLLKL